jgi:hypothetical protein
MLTPRLVAVAAGLALTLALPTAASAGDGRAAGTDWAANAAGITYDGHGLVVFDPATGRSAGGAFDRNSVFLDADYSGSRGLFYVQLVDGREKIIGPRVSATGRRVTVSPDGRFLAYVNDPDGPAKGSLMERITVRNLDTGVERHFAGPPVPDGIPAEMDDPTINDLAISPDSTRLAYDYSDGGVVLVLDLVSGTSLADAQPVPAPGYVHDAAWLGTETLAAVGVDGDVKVLPADGEGEVGTYFLPGSAEDLDVDDGGRLMVKLVAPSQTPPAATTTYAMVGRDGIVATMNQPYHTVVW